MLSVQLKLQLKLHFTSKGIFIKSLLIFKYLTQEELFDIQKTICVTDVTRSELDIISLSICTLLCVSDADCHSLTYYRHSEQCDISYTDSTAACTLSEDEGTILRFKKREFHLPFHTKSTG